VDRGPAAATGAIREPTDDLDTTDSIISAYGAADDRVDEIT
jgi:hypothetical protein